MTRHASHAMHPNSLAIDISAFSDRSRAILRYLSTQIGPKTDREIMEALGFTDMNAVRPRLSEMVKRHILGEGPTVVDSRTGKHVRTVQVVVRLQESLLV